jgi:hypothetical protein
MGNIMVGCIASTDEFRATIAGNVIEENETQAQFTVTPIGREVFNIRVTRQPAEGTATGVDIVNESGDVGFFRSAEDLPRCATTVTCEGLGLPQTFAPEGGS